MLYRFSNTSLQGIQHVNELGILNHVEHVFSFLTKQHVEFMNQVKSVDLFSHISAPLPYPTKQYAEQTKKIGILSQFCDLPPIDPTR